MSATISEVIKYPEIKKNVYADKSSSKAGHPCMK